MYVLCRLYIRGEWAYHHRRTVRLKWHGPMDVLCVHKGRGLQRKLQMHAFGSWNTDLHV